MKIIEPKVELWKQDDPIAHVARCARICYGKTKGKSTDQQLYDNLLKLKHYSVLRHNSVYAIIPLKDCLGCDFSSFYECPWFEYKCYKSCIYIVTNGNFIVDHKNKPLLISSILNHRVTAEQFANTEAGYSMMRYTFHVTTQISTSRELNRVSPNSITEESTRFVRIGEIVRPHWMSKENADKYCCFGVTTHDDNPIVEYINACGNSFDSYRHLLSLGMKREDARGVLPLDTATEVVYTYSATEWKHIIELRTAKSAHPNARIIANMLKKELEELGYEFS